MTEDDWEATRAIRSDGVAGMPCSDCCHALFGRVPPGIPEITAYWPCTKCGKTVFAMGGYHTRGYSCDTDLNVRWPGGPPLTWSSR